MTSRSAFLATIRAQLPKPVELSDEAHSQIQALVPFTEFADVEARRTHFERVLEGFGGMAIDAPAHSVSMDASSASPNPRPTDWLALIEQHWPDAGQKRVVDYTAQARVQEAGTPHDYHDVDIAIVRGQLAVAENAAVWVSDAHVPQRAVYFLCQRLVLVVPRDALVNNMRDAYERLTFAAHGFGVFIAGASRTADIEQSLVLGAHGAMAAMVIFE